MTSRRKPCRTSRSRCVRPSSLDRNTRRPALCKSLSCASEAASFSVGVAMLPPVEALQVYCAVRLQVNNVVILQVNYDNWLIKFHFSYRPLSRWMAGNRTKEPSSAHVRWRRASNAQWPEIEQKEPSS